MKSMFFGLFAMTSYLTAQPQTDSSANFTVCGSTIQVDFSTRPIDLSKSDLLRWVRMAAESVATYYGRFPVAHDTVRIMSIPDRKGVLSGRTWGGENVRSRMGVGEHATVAELNEDWTMTHEFVHTAFPDLDEKHHWIEEGLATYIEPIARVQHGSLKQEQVWSDTIRDMHQGEPGEGDEGLDHTHTHGRTYWGGAMFFIVADVSIRDRTQNKKGLQDALRAILQSGKSIQEDSHPMEAFSIGDAATGVPVLTEMYEEWRDKPVPIDLNGLWRRFGVKKSASGEIIYDQKAPSAGARDAIFRRPAVKSCIAGS